MRSKFLAKAYKVFENATFVALLSEMRHLRRHLPKDPPPTSSSDIRRTTYVVVLYKTQHLRRRLIQDAPHTSLSVLRQATSVVLRIELPHLCRYTDYDAHFAIASAILSHNQGYLLCSFLTIMRATEDDL